MNDNVTHLCHVSAKLKRVFTKLHFLVEQHDDLTDVDIQRLLVDKAHNVDHREYDCFVCCILSHGGLGLVYGTNGKPVKIKDLTTSLTPSRCPTLANKPKLFFIQACQGREVQQGNYRNINCRK
jgi:hypothetical protein